VFSTHDILEDNHRAGLPIPGAVAKRTRLTQVTDGTTSTLDWDTTYAYDNEGYLITTGYPGGLVLQCRSRSDEASGGTVLCPAGGREKELNDAPASRVPVLD
jgi:hypothetical protein